MSTVAEIEAAIDGLSSEDRRSLEERLLVRYCLEAADEAERAALFASLDEAEAEIERGEGFTAREMRDAVRS